METDSCVYLKQRKQVNRRRRAQPADSDNKQAAKQAANPTDERRGTQPCGNITDPRAISTLQAPNDAGGMKNAAKLAKAPQPLLREQNNR